MTEKIEYRIDLKHPVTVCKASAGTGKTYTLAAYYIGLLLSRVDFRSILAITFTNKATSEMSERILTNLYALSLGADPNFLKDAKRFMIGNFDATDSELAALAGECFRKMLADFDNVQIKTIDSFMQTLLSGLGGLLGQNIGANTQIDTKQIVQQAVDRILTMPEGDVDQVLEKFIQSRLNDDSNLDIRKSLCLLGEDMYNETVQLLDAEKKIRFDGEFIESRRQELLAQWENNTYPAQIQAELNRIKLIPLDDKYGKANCNAIRSMIAKAETSLQMKKIDQSTYFDVLTPTQWKAVRNREWKDMPASIMDAVEHFANLCMECRRLYNTIFLTIELSHEMELMSALQRMIIQQLDETNSSLLSRTARILSEALESGDADFILEKAGIRYHHVLMDEFQDTSCMQWDVIRQLLMDVLAGTGNTMLIVGDIKQSIYRWRNGDWHIMANLDNAPKDPEELDLHTRINPRFTSLKRNFRSSERVVAFNLSLFQYILSNYAAVTGREDPEEQKLAKEIYSEQFEAEHLAEFYQADKKQGGYVQFKAFKSSKQDNGSTTIIYEMFDEIERLLSQGASAADIMILIRKGKEAMLITDAFACADPKRYPNLKATHMVSAVSFELAASEAVQRIISGLRYVVSSDPIAVQQIVAAKSEATLETISDTLTPDTPLYEAVSELIKILLADADGQYTDTEIAYVNCLLDRTRDYIRANGSDIEAFLQYWDDTLSSKSIPVSGVDAIRIMTIHKSKGLQAQTVFIPFCNWAKDDSKSSQKIWCQVPKGEDFVPIYNKKSMNDSAYQSEYQFEHLNAYIDSINMLYVAVTRAEDNLFVYSTYSSSSKSHVGWYIMEQQKMKAPKDDSVLEYRCGVQPVIKIRQTPTLGVNDPSKPFSFENMEKTQAELWSNSDQVRFIQSQEGALYTAYGEQNAYERVAKIDEGTLCHEIFSRIRKADQLDAVLDESMSSGLIASEEQRDKLKSLISSAWNGNEAMQDWFTAPWELRLEEAIFIGRKEIRPDRVMINPITNEAIVLDYKFGEQMAKHRRQVRDYMTALRGIGYSPVRGYLWYAQTNTLKEVES